MKSFLVKGKKPIIKWGQLPNETYFEGVVPEGYSLAVCPSGEKGYVIIDVDCHGNKNGFDNIPKKLISELDNTLNYPTKNNGKHYWVRYTGNKPLGNKTSGLGIDLRTNKGYVVWNYQKDVRECLHLINDSSLELNQWLEKLFSYKYEKDEN
jgi:hypothetical protein